MTGPEVLDGRYELHGVLGRGGMAEIRDGWDTRLHRAVAIKLLHPGFDTQPDALSRFAEEARSAAALSHPNVVAVHDTGEHLGTPYIVMERLSGRTLADRIAGGPLATPYVRTVLDEVLAALAAAHRAGIVHRDIKPANILFGARGEAKVTDFGIAKTAGAGITATGHIIGTMAYLSPQRLAGAPATPADDLYAVGVVGFEALTGRRPFDADNPGALARAIMDDHPPPVRLSRPDVTPALADAIERAMARDPAQRYPHATAMRDALAGRTVTPSGTRVMEVPLPPPVLPSPTAGPLMPPRPPTRTRRLVVIGAAVAAVLLALVVVLFESASGSGPAPAGTDNPATTPSSTLAPSPTTSASFSPTAVPPNDTQRGNPHRGGPNGPPKKPKHGDDG